MAIKFCPLSFFSFYVNKEHAQAGGAHHCVEDACALWDESYEQCGLKTAVEAVGTLAEAGALPIRRQARRNELTSAVRGGLSSSFDKLRKRKKLPSVEQAPSKVEVTHPAVVAGKISTGVATQPAPISVSENKVIQTEQKVANSTVVVKEPVEKNHENNQLTLPIASEISIANPAKTLPPTKVETPKVETTKVETPKFEPLQDDFSDLLNPPSIPISELPIVSKPIDDEREIPTIKKFKEAKAEARKQGLDAVLEDLVAATKPEPEPVPVIEVTEPVPVIEVIEPVIEVTEPVPVIEVTEPLPVTEPAPDDPLAEILEASRLVPTNPEVSEIKAEWRIPDDLPIPEEFLEKPKPKGEEN